jgi:hypothetical protein
MALGYRGIAGMHLSISHFRSAASVTPSSRVAIQVYLFSFRSLRTNAMGYL